MKLLWHRAWRDAPCYSVPSRGQLVAVEAALPLVPVVRAAGRVLRRPRRKVLTGVLADGGTPVVALACRVPPAAEYLVVPEALVHGVERPLGGAELARFGEAVVERLPNLAELG